MRTPMTPGCLVRANLMTMGNTPAGVFHHININDIALVITLNRRSSLALCLYVNRPLLWIGAGALGIL